MESSEAWARLVDGLREAGEHLEQTGEGLTAGAQADRYLALLRGLNNQLGRFEVDRERPELVAFNGWREKFLMDNPDFRYWVADVRDDRRYRITGGTGDAVYLSITVYGTAGGEAHSLARVDSDDAMLVRDGHFEVTLSREPPAAGAWLPLPEGARSVWLRQFHADVAADELGWCEIEPLDPPTLVMEAEAATETEARFVRQLRRLGRTMGALPLLIDAATAADRDHPNEARHWSEMTGGAAFTEPGIHYVRGSWELDDGEALVLDGPVVACRYWNVLLYSPSLNSLDHRNRPVSRTGATARLHRRAEGDRYRFVLAAEDPGGPHDWLDTEGRAFGIFVMRWLHPEHPPELPEVRRCRLDDLDGAR